MKGKISHSVIRVIALLGVFTWSITLVKSQTIDTPWTVTIGISLAGTGQDTVKFGTKVGATDALDVGIDILNPPTPPNSFDAFFQITHPLFPNLSQDFRSNTAGLNTWTLMITQTTGSNGTMKWDTSTVPGNGELELRDGRAVLANMLSVDSLNFTGDQNFTVFWTPPVFVILIFPEEGAVLDNGRTDFLDPIIWDFDWVDVAGASQYNIYVKGANAQIPVIDDMVVTSELHDESFSFIIEANRLGWEWKVRAMVDGQWSPFSETRTFDVEPVNTDPPLVVPNDNCAQASLVSSLPHNTTCITTVATSEPSDPVLTCAGGGGGNTVWFTFTSAIAQTVSANTFGSDYDTALGIFTGSCGSLTEIACNDDAGSLQSEIVWQVQAGVPYLIHVAEFNGGSGGGNLVFNLQESTPPTPLVFKVERTTGDVYADGSFISAGADLAERIQVSEPVEPGDVVELDPNNPRHYRKARGNSKLIAGVITTEPGFTLGNSFENEASVKATANRPMLTLMGRVPVNVTTENGPIRPGDLLTVSSKPGYAVRCAQAKECNSVIIGKAMEGLKTGEGKILVLVMSH